ncbi:GumC family protein [Novosphingobium terrae]|uniref:GumC family protein n=1 Tax=Novosphingobium terrae TaxID=2726189 RepID=UPI00198209AD|nr:AAA family ATPase [Novosphingobium terrae]
MALEKVNIVVSQSIDGAEQSSQHDSGSGSTFPDPTAIVAIFQRRLWWFIAPLCAAAILLGLYLVLVHPRYTAEASIVIEPRKTDVITSNRNIAAAPDARPANDEVDTEVQILTSTTMAGRVAQALHLEQYPEYRTTQSMDYNHAIPSKNPLAETLLKHMLIQRTGLTFVITVAAKSKDPVLASRIANEYVRQYIAAGLDEKNHASDATGAFLQSKLDELRKDAVSADAAVQRYKVEHGLMSAEGATMAEQEVSSLNEEIAKARADYAEKRGRLNSARALAGQSDGQNLQTALQSPTISELRSKEAEASRRLADLSAHYGELYPEVIRTQKELADIRTQISRELQRIVSSLNGEAQIAESRLASLTQSQAAASGKLASNSVSQIELLELQRKAEGASAIYAAYLNRSNEIISRKGLNSPDARISALSPVPTVPTSPNIPLAVLSALLAGVGLGIAGVFFAEYLDSGVSTKADVERRLRVRYAGSVPELKSTLGNVRVPQSPQDYIIDHPNSAFAEAFRSLRAILMLRSNSGPRVVAITSALPREGKSTTSICLARTFVGSEIRTVLVDCDIRRRSASDALLPPDSRGLLDYFAGKVSITEAIVQDRFTNLSVLGTTIAADAGHDIMTRANIDRMLEDLRAHFDVILLDTAPVLALAETRDLAVTADSVLIVTRWRATSRKAVDAAIQLLLNAGARVRGLALSRVDVSKFASTGPEDIYSYHKKFAGYYVN